MRGKRGWIRILEATIAVMIVASVMLISYSDQVQDWVSFAEYSESLQNEILFDIVSDMEYRLNVLNVVVDDVSDSNYTEVDEFVESRVPIGFGYLLRICKLGDTSDFCKMNLDDYVATIDKDIYVEETIVSSEVGDGDAKIYAPKKVKLFFWRESSP